MLRPRLLLVTTGRRIAAEAVGTALAGGNVAIALLQAFEDPAALTGSADAYLQDFAAKAA